MAGVIPAAPSVEDCTAGGGCLNVPPGFSAAPSSGASPVEGATGRRVDAGVWPGSSKPAGGGFDRGGGAWVLAARPPGVGWMETAGPEACVGRRRAAPDDKVHDDAAPEDVGPPPSCAPESMAGTGVMIFILFTPPL